MDTCDVRRACRWHVPPPDHRHQCCVAGMTTPLHRRLSTLTQLFSTISTSAAAAVTVVLLNCAVCAISASSTNITDRDRPAVVYLTRGMTDRVDCPAKAKPPSTLIMWSRNNHVLDTTSSDRLYVDEFGALVIDNVTTADAGLYTCIQYSPLKRRNPDFNLTVIVKGTSHLLQLIALLFFSLCLFLFT